MSSSRSSQGSLMSMPRSLQLRMRSRWHSSPRSPWKGFMAPCLMESVGSGTAFSRSRPMIRPKPRHLGQAPRGELKEKRAGVGARRVKPVLGLLQLVVNDFVIVDFGSWMVAWPFPRRNAASRASRRRELFSGEIFRRSWTMARAAGSLAGGVSSVRRISPLMRTRR